jgi:hypothetical protein
MGAPMGFHGGPTRLADAGDWDKAQLYTAGAGLIVVICLTGESGSGWRLTAIFAVGRVAERSGPGPCQTGDRDGP